MDEGRHPCSDEDVDAALATFRSEVRVPEASVRRARERLTSVIERDAGEAWAPAPLRVVPRVAVVDPPPRRRALRPAASGLVAAAAVAALVVGVLTVSSRVGGGVGRGGDVGPAAGGGSVTSAAAPARADEVLTRSADLLDAEKPDGRRFRYVESHSWQRTSLDRGPNEVPFIAMNDTVTRNWVPADADDEWQTEREYDVQRKWIEGDDQALRALRAEDPSRHGGFDDRVPPKETLRGRGGLLGGPRQTAAQAWEDPTSRFVAGLPRDPQQLVDRLRHDVPKNPREKGDASGTPSTMLLYATDFLKTGAAPPDLRAALYRALAKVPGLAVTDGAADVDGRRGTALGITDPDGNRLEMIVDPRTGAFLGTRTTDADGTVQNVTTVTTAGADQIGVVPTG